MRIRMTKLTVWLLLGTLLAAIIVLGSAVYTVQEWEQVIITQFGRPVGGVIKTAGLHWKLPFVQHVHRFEKRLLEFDGEATEIPTRDKKFIFIDTFARWRIVDPLLFYQSVKDEAMAKTRLDDIIDSETRDVISGHILIEAVRNTNRPLLADAEMVKAANTVPGLSDVGLPTTVPAEKEPPAKGTTLPAPGRKTISVSVRREQILEGREVLNSKILTSAAKKVRRLGIELVDVRIKSINFVPQVQERVYERMISEREQIADRYRAGGEKISRDIAGRTQRERDRILSEAYREAETTMGLADAEAAKIYSEAYGLDPEFYAFWKSLQIYRTTLGGNISLVLDANNDIFRYLQSAGTAPLADGPPPPKQ